MFWIEATAAAWQTRAVCVGLFYFSISDLFLAGFLFVFN